MIKKNQLNTFKKFELRNILKMFLKYLMLTKAVFI